MGEKGKRKGMIGTLRNEQFTEGRCQRWNGTGRAKRDSNGAG